MKKHIAEAYVSGMVADVYMVDGADGSFEFPTARRDDGTGKATILVGIEDWESVLLHELMEYNLCALNTCVHKEHFMSRSVGDRMFMFDHAVFSEAVARTSDSYRFLFPLFAKAVKQVAREQKGKK